MKEDVRELCENLKRASQAYFMLANVLEWERKPDSEIAHAEAKGQAYEKAHLRALEAYLLSYKETPSD